MEPKGKFSKRIAGFLCSSGSGVCAHYSRDIAGRPPNIPFVHSSSSALFRSDRGKGGPALLDLLAAAVWALNLSFLIIDEGNNFIEEFLAAVAKEFVVGHEGLHDCEVYEKNSRRLGQIVQYGSGHEFCGR